MKPLNKSRKKVCVGDIFTLKVGDMYYFGRVIRTDAGFGENKIWNLIYIYEAQSKDKNDIPTLDKNRLLIPPYVTNRQAWLRGYLKLWKTDL